MEQNEKLFYDFVAIIPKITITKKLRNRAKKRQKKQHLF